MTSIDTTDRTLWELVEARAEATPDATMAIDEAGRTMTFAGYRDWCERVAAGLATTYGVGEDTRVSWVLPSRFEALVLAGALSRLGAVQNPILPIYRHREVSFITAQSGAALLVVPGEFRNFDFAAMATEVTAGSDTAVLVADPDLPEGDPTTLPPFEPERNAMRWLFYSSGTTADPKGAKHTDASLSAANAGMQWAMQVTSDDKAAVVFPVTHVGGLVWLFNAMETGVELLMVEVFDPVGTPVWLGEHVLVPIRRWVQQNESVAATDLLTTDLGVDRRPAEHVVQGRHVTQNLLHGPGDERRVGRHGVPLVGMVGESA